MASAWSGRVPSFVVDATQQPDAANFYGIEELPTTLILRYGSVVGYPEIGAAPPSEINEIFQRASVWV